MTDLAIGRIFNLRFFAFWIESNNICRAGLNTNSASDASVYTIYRHYYALKFSKLISNLLLLKLNMNLPPIFPLLKSIQQTPQFHLRKNHTRFRVWFTFPLFKRKYLNLRQFINPYSPKFHNELAKSQMFVVFIDFFFTSIKTV